MYTYDVDDNPRKKNKHKDFAEGCLMILGAILLFIILCLLGAAIAMWLWNVIMVPVFGMPALGYWQTYGIMILAKLIFGGKSVSSSSKN